VAAERRGTRDELITEFVAYAGTDLLSYHRDAPDDFVERQTANFGPWLDWAEQNGVPLRTTTGIIAIEQDAGTLARLEAHAQGYSDLALTFLVHMTATFGSAMLALAVMQGALEAGAGYDISRMDESYRAEIWGADEDAEARAAAIRAEIVAMSAILGELGVPSLCHPS
jgi:chaperone required for assembly of F1-ATPase